MPCPEGDRDRQHQECDHSRAEPVCEIPSEESAPADPERPNDPRADFHVFDPYRTTRPPSTLKRRSAPDPLPTSMGCDNIAPMRTGASFSKWWRPLPLWLKGVSLLFGCAAWLFIGYSVLSGQAKSETAFLAFVVFAAVAILHFIFDRRNRRGEHERSGFDVSDGGE